MTYELAKKLKDAGFPQTGKSHNWFINGVIQFNPIQVTVNDDVYEPDLSELIEAVGDRFWSLFMTDNALGKWEATDKNINGWINNIRVFGNTPEETVAKLWLALNQLNQLDNL